MKNILRILTINLVFLFLLSFTVFSLSCGSGIVPNKPHVFHGTALLSGNAVAGKTVVATLDGNTFSATTGSDGSYVVDVSRCSDRISVTSVSFTVCTRSAAESGSFGDGSDTEQNLTISSACPSGGSTGGGSSGGGSGGGGGGGAGVSSETNLDIKAGFATNAGHTASQTQGDTVTFTMGGIKYTAELTKLTDNSITITVSGISKTLSIGGSAKFDVNGDGVADLFVQLLAIEGGRAEVVYRALFTPSMMVLLDAVRAFYAGTSDLTMMGLLDQIRAFYGG